jgi:hypothetical protein
MISHLRQTSNFICKAYAAREFCKSHSSVPERQTLHRQPTPLDRPVTA